ncbi:MAG: hypothetical protein SGJ09_01800 [Phycisphaerae bacterium]|nr:hypothetical protein [Phycisphaerae bacterium]
MPWECADCGYLVVGRDAICAECGARASRFLFDSAGVAQEEVKRGSAPSARSWRKRLAVAIRVAIGVGILWIFVAVVVNVSMSTGGACWLAVAGLLLLAFWRPLLGLPSVRHTAPSTGVWIEDGTLFGSFEDGVTECDFICEDESISFPLEVIDSISSVVADGIGCWRMTLRVTDRAPVTHSTRCWHHRGEVAIQFCASASEAVEVERTVRDPTTEAQQFAPSRTTRSSSARERIRETPLSALC